MVRIRQVPPAKNQAYPPVAMQCLGFTFSKEGKEFGMNTESYWRDTHGSPEFPALDRDIEVDVVVVGGGLTGITAAYLLRKEGVRVALIERDKICSGDTSRTTAHLTYVTDYRLHEVASKFGRDAARAF